MTRVNIRYGGGDYSIGGRPIDDIQAEIDEALAADRPTWLHVNSGEGQYQPARLLIIRGVDIALNAVDETRSGPEYERPLS